MKSFLYSSIKSQNSQGFGRAFWSSLPNNQGQAVVEYILIIVVAVLFIGGLSIALFKPLGDFVQGLNQTYVQCLLETGELPTLRSENPSVLCADQFPQFNQLTMDGQPITPGQGGANGKNNQPQENASNADTAGGSGSSLGAGNTAAYNRKSSIIRNGMRGVGNARTDTAGDKTTTIPVDEFNEGSGFMNMSSGGAGRYARRAKERKIAIASMTEYDRKKLEREEQKISNLPLQEGESFTQKAKKKFTVKPPPEKEKEQEIEVGGGFSFYIKIFFLIILVIFILILFGGQAMQISNNWSD